jgi:hypothetical protein
MPAHIMEFRKEYGHGLCHVLTLGKFCRYAVKKERAVNDATMQRVFSFCYGYKIRLFAIKTTRAELFLGKSLVSFGRSP